MLTALGLRGFVMQIYTVRSGGCRMWLTRARGRKGVVFTPNSHVRSSEVSNWQTFESHFADERIKWQSAQKLLQNIRITEMFLLLLYIHILYIYMQRYRFLVASFICILQFRIFWRFAIYFFTHSAAPAPVAIGMCIEFYFSAQHTDKLF